MAEKDKGIIIGRSPKVWDSEQLILGCLRRAAELGRTVSLKVNPPGTPWPGPLDGQLKLSEQGDLQIRQGNNWLLLRGLPRWGELALDEPSFAAVCEYTAWRDRSCEESHRVRFVERLDEEKKRPQPEKKEPKKAGYSLRHLDKPFYQYPRWYIEGTLNIDSKHAYFYFRLFFNQQREWELSVAPPVILYGQSFTNWLIGEVKKQHPNPCLA